MIKTPQSQYVKRWPVRDVEGSTIVSYLNDTLSRKTRILFHFTAGNPHSLAEISITADVCLL